MKKRPRRTERFQMVMSRETKSLLTKMALADDCSRSDWLNKAIRREAIQRGVLK